MANEQAKAFVDQATQSLQNSQFQQALELVDQAIAIEPGASDSHVLRGICLSQLGQPDAATEAFGRRFRSRRTTRRLITIWRFTRTRLATKRRPVNLRGRRSASIHVMPRRSNS